MIPACLLYEVVLKEGTDEGRRVLEKSGLSKENVQKIIDLLLALNEKRKCSSYNFYLLQDVILLSQIKSDSEEHSSSNQSSPRQFFTSTAKELAKRFLPQSPSET